MPAKGQKRSQRSVMWCPRNEEWLRRKAREEPSRRNEYGRTWDEQLQHHRGEAELGRPSFECSPRRDDPHCMTCDYRPSDLHIYPASPHMAPLASSKTESKPSPPAFPRTRAKKQTGGPPPVLRPLIRTPPEELRITLSSTDIAQGCIHLTSALRQLIEYLGLEEELNLTVYGKYILSAFLKNEALRGSELEEWMIENELREGDVVRLRVEEGQSLRLYTAFERGTLEQGEEVRHGRRRLWRRDWVHEALESLGQFSHVSVIARQVRAIGGPELDPRNVTSVLCQSRHVFAPLPACRGLWGLRKWLGRQGPPPVDLVSVHLVIGEQELVSQTLREAGQPLSAKEIAEAIAPQFCIAADELLSTTFIDPKDPEIVILNDGRWALAEWVKNWQRELQELEARLELVRATSAPAQTDLCSETAPPPKGHTTQRWWMALAHWFLQAVGWFAKVFGGKSPHPEQQCADNLDQPGDTTPGRPNQPEERLLPDDLRYRLEELRYLVHLADSDD